MQEKVKARKTEKKFLAKYPSKALGKPKLIHNTASSEIMIMLLMRKTGFVKEMLNKGILVPNSLQWTTKMFLERRQRYLSTKQCTSQYLSMDGRTGYYRARKTEKKRNKDIR